MKYWDVRLPPNGSLYHFPSAERQMRTRVTSRRQISPAPFKFQEQSMATCYFLAPSKQILNWIWYDMIWCSIFWLCQRFPSGSRTVPAVSPNLKGSPMGSCKVPRLSSKTTRLQACELTKFYGPHGFQSSKVSEHHRILKFLLRFKAPGLKKKY